MHETHTDLELEQKARAERKLRGQATTRYCQRCGDPGAGWTSLTEDSELYAACHRHFTDGPPDPVKYDFRTGEALAG